MNQKALKSMLGALGTLVLYFLAVYGGVVNPTTIPQNITVLAGFILGLLAIKKYGVKGSTLGDNK